MLARLVRRWQKNMLSRNGRNIELYKTVYIKVIVSKSQPFSRIIPKMADFLLRIR